MTTVELPVMVDSALHGLAIPPEFDEKVGLKLVTPVIKSLLQVGGFDYAHLFVEGVLAKFPVTDPDGIHGPISGPVGPGHEQLNLCVFEALLSSLLEAGDIENARGIVEMYGTMQYGTPEWGYIYIAELTGASTDVDFAIQQIHQSEDEREQAKNLSHLVASCKSRQALDELKEHIQRLEKDRHPSTAYAYLQLMEAIPGINVWCKAANALEFLPSNERRVFAQPMVRLMLEEGGVEGAKVIMTRFAPGEVTTLFHRLISNRDQSVS